MKNITWEVLELGVDSATLTPVRPSPPKCWPKDDENGGEGLWWCAGTPIAIPPLGAAAPPGAEGGEGAEEKCGYWGCDVGKVRLKDCVGRGWAGVGMGGLGFGAWIGFGFGFGFRFGLGLGLGLGFGEECVGAETGGVDDVEDGSRGGDGFGGWDCEGSTVLRAVVPVAGAWESIENWECNWKFERGSVPERKREYRKHVYACSLNYAYVYICF